MKTFRFEKAMMTCAVFIILYSSGNCITSPNSTVDPKGNSSEDDDQAIDEKDNILGNCTAYALLPDEYVMFSNGTAYVEAYNMTYNSSFYNLEGDVLKVCVPTIDGHDLEGNESWKFADPFEYVTGLGLTLSILCLLLHLTAFCLVRELRNLPGWNLASLCVSLLFGYSSFMLSHIENISEYKGVCIAVACIAQYFLLASFMWMSTMAFDVFRSLLKATGKLRVATKRFSYARFVIYSLYSWGTPAVIVSVTIYLDHVESLPERYRPSFGQSYCWFNRRLPLAFLFVIPMSILIFANLLFFGMSAYVIFKNRMKTEQAEYRKVLKRNCVMYFRLSSIMGLTWIVGFLAAVVDQNWMWYIFLLLNTMQGVFIFLGFTCTSKVKMYCKEKLRLRDRKVSTATQCSIPTFQSYCNTGFYEDDSEYTREEDLGRS